MLNYLNTRKENYNGGKINYKTGEDVASCINASSGSLDISDNIIVDNPDKSYEDAGNKIIPLDKHSSSVGLNCVGAIGKEKKWIEGDENLQRNFSQGYRIYSPDGKCPTLSSQSGGPAGTGNTLITGGKSASLCANGGGSGAKTGLYLVDEIPVENNNEIIEAKGVSMTGQFGNRKLSTSDKGYCLAANPSSDMQPMVQITKEEEVGQEAEEDVTSGTLRTHKDGNGFREVKSGKGATIPARAREDGSGQNVVKIMSRIRRLTPVECERLQTFPDYYTDKGISDTQRYKMLGNSWTVEVIKYIFGHLPYKRHYSN
jgi:hypothetical protein